MAPRSRIRCVWQAWHETLNSELRVVLFALGAFMVGITCVLVAQKLDGRGTRTIFRVLETRMMCCKCCLGADTIHGHWAVVCLPFWIGLTMCTLVTGCVGRNSVSRVRYCVGGQCSCKCSCASNSLTAIVLQGVWVVLISVSISIVRWASGDPKMTIVLSFIACWVFLGYANSLDS